MSRRRAARHRQSRRARVATAASIFGTAAVCFALAGPAQAQSARGQQGGDVPVSLVITSVTPAYATPGQTVTVSGSITNTSSAAISGISVRLRSSNSPFLTRDDLQEYASGNEPGVDGYEPGAATRRPITLAVRATKSWSVALRVNKVGMTGFGVYPLAAEADSAAGTALDGGTSRTFLPYWPGKHGQPRPLQQEIAWILPIIGQPVQGPCPGLLNNSLAASLAPGGRLSSLLAAGQAELASTHLTWAIDPALLGSVQTMTRPYRVGGSAGCLTGYRTLPASHAAAAWLAGLKQATTGQGVFVTPYADVDIAALTWESLDSDLVSAFTQGRSVAGSVLHRNFSPGPAGKAGNSGDAAPLAGMAWPADGLASRAALENLAATNINVTAVVLDSSTMPPVPGDFAPASAVTSTANGVTGNTRVLLADDTITQILSSANSPSDSAGTAFAVRQRFLAETAMIAAQAPNIARSIVVAPPRRWSPPAGLAQSLLAETASAPWLKPVSLSQLATAKLPPDQPARQPLPATAKGELSGHLLGQIKGLDRRISLLESIRVRQDPSLSRAVASVESSAWRGAVGGGQAQALLDQVLSYLTSQEQALTITKPIPVTLGGLKGSPPISISSHLDYPVQVRLEISVPGGGGMTITPPTAKTIQIPPNSVKNVTLNVHAKTVGSTTIHIALLAPDGTTLPGTSVTMTIRATQFGTLALVILAAALGVFMITSAARAIRQGSGAAHKTDPASSEGGGTDDVGPRHPGDAGTDGSVVTDHAEQQAGHQTAGDVRIPADDDPTEETNEFARAPGWADRD